MNLAKLIAGLVALLVGVLLVLKRHAVAAFAADSARENATAASLLNRERTERDMVRPYTSTEGRRTSGQQSVLWGVLLCGIGLYLVALSF